ncbi:MAG: FAD-dependent oxidoreductase [Proteobacteria bacterium]|nr:FAD-dependent oxidoreductase [Pseudomonadota bacterium]
MTDVIVIGAGFGGLAAAIELASSGLEVVVYEAGPRVGGKADEVVIDGVACDTGPTLLTLPEVADQVFRSAGSSLADEVTLVQPDPAFRYHYPDGQTLDVHHAVDDTLVSVRAAFGEDAAGQLATHLDRARRIWEATRETFIFGAAPTFGRVLSLGPKAWWSLSKVDTHRTLWDVICEDVQDERLRWLLARYATYNGSDVRTAPGTLACIAWVELGLGAWGVHGGMHALATALARTARRLGVRIHTSSPVEGIELSGQAVTGVRVGGRVEACHAVVCNGDASHLAQALLPASARGAVGGAGPRSTSGWVGVFRAAVREDRAAHEVVFPRNYLDEFHDLFDRRRSPVEPTVYTCALSGAHGRAQWADAEPMFAMINAPALPADDPARWGALARQRLLAAGRIHRDDELVWERSPRELAARFPDTGGAIYGASSSSALAAFRRPANQISGIDGLYLAGGSAHPGGGVPLCLQSGRQAAGELLLHLGLQRVAK